MTKRGMWVVLAFLVLLFGCLIAVRLAPYGVWLLAVTFTLLVFTLIGVAVLRSLCCQRDVSTRR